MSNQELFEQYQNTRDVSLRNEIVESYLYMVNILKDLILQKVMIFQVLQLLPLLGK